MTNKEKFKEVFGVELGESLDFDTSCSSMVQIVALRSMYIKGVDCICEWLNAEYKDNQGNIMRPVSAQSEFGIPVDNDGYTPV